jgi:PAS domain S-box-containing protein
MTLWVNKAYSDITGVDGKELLGRNVRDLASEGYFYPSVTIHAIEKQRVVNSHLRIKTGKVIFATSVPIKDRENKIKFVVTNFRDMTELNLLSQQLEEADQLKERYFSMVKILNKQQIEMGDDVVFNSKGMREIFDLVLKIANLDVTVLLTGETGVGKDVIAKILHEKKSSKGLFIKVNCGAIPENLLESELFGYEKGAFTGAQQRGEDRSL